MRGERKINGRHGHPVVRDRKVELNSERGPRTSVANPRFLDRGVGVEHRLPTDLVHTGVNVSVDVRQNGAFQILVFEIDCPQLMLMTLFRSLVSQSIRIVEPVSRKLVERRIGIWRSFFVYRQIEDAFPDANLRKTRERRGKQKEEDELPSHRFHLKGIDSQVHVETMMQDSACPGRSVQWKLFRHAIDYSTLRR